LERILKKEEKKTFWQICKTDEMGGQHKVGLGKISCEDGWWIELAQNVVHQLAFLLVVL
jgi:hypothetical protein